MVDVDAVKRWCEDSQRRLGTAAQPSPMRFPLVSAVVTDAQAPAMAVAARDFYRQACADWGGAWILRQEIAGEVMFLVFAGTDGDDAWLEFFTADGAPVVAGAHDGYQMTWATTDRIRARVGAEP